MTDAGIESDLFADALEAEVDGGLPDAHAAKLELADVLWKPGPLDAQGPRAGVGLEPEHARQSVRQRRGGPGLRRARHRILDRLALLPPARVSPRKPPPPGGP